jgi:tRNA(Ile)-lysidine synthase
LTIDRTKLLISPRLVEVGEVQIERGQTVAHLGNWQLKLAEGTNQKPVDDSHVAMLDIATLQFPLRWRCWQAGDVFYPLGMKGRKKVSDLLIDAKVSMVDKASVTVLTSGEAIVWVAGYRLDERYKLTEQTKEVLILTLSPYFT